MLLAAALIQWLPFVPQRSSACAERGVFWSVLTSVELFSLSILVYLSWIATSNTQQLREISSVMGHRHLSCASPLVSFFYLRESRPAAFAGGSAIAAAVFAYGHYCMNAVKRRQRALRAGTTRRPRSGVRTSTPAGSRSIRRGHGVFLLALGMIAVGLLWTSTLNRRMVFGVFAAGWVGLLPYYYESFASSTHPPMNWGVPASRAGFYYAVTRLQYPMSLPNLIMDKVGTAIGVVRPDAVHDAGISNANYGHRLWLTLYYYGDNLQDNFTVPLIFLTLAILLYIRRCDWRQVSWFIFLIAAFFTLGFMLHLISPPMAFDFQNNMQYKVFNLQSHCIFVILLGYGALAAVLYLNEMVPDLTTRFGPGRPRRAGDVPGRLPCRSGATSTTATRPTTGSGYQVRPRRHHGADGSQRRSITADARISSRFVPTFMAFVESQQPARWKHCDSGFDRRDVAVITQNALCDSYYSQYIRQQYESRFRPRYRSAACFRKIPGPWAMGKSRFCRRRKSQLTAIRGVARARHRISANPPVLCLGPDEFNACWSEYLAAARRLRRAGTPVGRGRTKRHSPRHQRHFRDQRHRRGKDFPEEHVYQAHTFLSRAKHPDGMDLSPTCCRRGLHLFQALLRNEAQPLIPPADVAADHAFWDAYAAKLLADPKFRLDDDATVTFGKLAMNHADLYRWRGLVRATRNISSSSRSSSVRSCRTRSCGWRRSISTSSVTTRRWRHDQAGAGRRPAQ